MVLTIFEIGWLVGLRLKIMTFVFHVDTFESLKHPEETKNKM